MGRAKKALLLVLCAVMMLGAPAQALAATNGWKTKNEKTYYYKDGEKVKGVVKIGGKLYAFDSKGVLQGKTAVFTWEKKYYQVSKKGIAKRWTGTSELAAKLLASKAMKAGTEMEQLKKAFAYCVGLKYVRVGSVSEAKAADYYGKLGLKNGAGDCAVQAYTFYWLAKVLGYKVKVINGYTKSSTYNEHSWVELTKSGKTYVCDPNFGKERAGQITPTGSYPLGMMFRYGAKKTLKYFRMDKTEIEKNGKA